MAFQNILVEKRNGVGWVTINRPDVLNALSRATITEIYDVIQEIGEDADTKVVVIRGAGKCFGVGADLKENQAIVGSDSGAAFRAWFTHWQRTLFAIERSLTPVIAAVHGYALAGSLELVMACDLAIATHDAQIADQHANFGLIPGGSASQRMPRLIGMRRAKELLLTGRWISGEEAERIGLVNKSVPPEEFEEAVTKYAEDLASKSAIAMGFTKEMVNWGADVDITTGIMCIERWLGAAAGTYPDLQEGVTAFNEKRAPKYRGKW